MSVWVLYRAATFISYLPVDCELCSLLWGRTQCSGQISWSGRAGTEQHYCQTESMKSCPWWPFIYLQHWGDSKPGAEFSSSCFHTPWTAGSCHMPSALVVAQVRTKSSCRKQQSNSKNVIFSLLGESIAPGLKLDAQYTKPCFNQSRALKGSSEQVISN